MLEIIRQPFRGICRLKKKQNNSNFLCNYFRLNMPSKEIASIEGITDGTVRVYKNKIKNKIGLSQLDSLNEYLVNISIKK